MRLIVKRMTFTDINVCVHVLNQQKNPFPVLIQKSGMIRGRKPKYTYKKTKIKKQGWRDGTEGVGVGG